MKTTLIRVSGETLQALRSLASELDEIGRGDGKMKNEFREASQNQLVFAAVRLARKEMLRRASAQGGGKCRGCDFPTVVGADLCEQCKMSPPPRGESR